MSYLKFAVSLSSNLRQNMENTYKYIQINRITTNAYNKSRHVDLLVLFGEKNTHRDYTYIFTIR
jgi:hypothetical protein